MADLRITLPELDDPRWRKLLLSESPPVFRQLVAQLMFSRLKMTLKADPSEAALKAAVVAMRDFFLKNQIKIQDDFSLLIRYMESSK